MVIPNVLGNDRQTDGPRVDGLSLWPGFRVLFTKKGFDLPTNILEPAYYWRIRRDYPTYVVPSPTVMVVNMSTIGGGGEEVSIGDVLAMLNSEPYRHQPRIVLSMNTIAQESISSLNHRLHVWSDDSVGRFSSFEEESGRYEALPKLIERAYNNLHEAAIFRSITRDTRLCADMFVFDKGNRSCFDKCD